MASKVFSLQQRIGYTIINKLESGEITLDRSQEIARKVLEIIPEDASDDKLTEIIKQINSIAELKGLDFGL